MTHIRIVDLPCGWSKSSLFMGSFKRDQNYIIVAPYHAEVQRFVEEAKKHSGFVLAMPIAKSPCKGS